MKVKSSKITKKIKVEIKKATIKDCDFLFLLRNEKISRKNSFTTKSIKKKNHIKWLKKELRKYHRVDNPELKFQLELVDEAFEDVMK